MVGRSRSATVLLGPAIAVTLYMLPIPAALDPNAWVVAALAVVMAIWWITEAIPLPMTALLPLVVLPATGISPIATVAIPYSSPIVLMLLGGFIIATSVERWKLHRRIALNIVARAGDSPAAIVGGFMLASAVLSMWISNSATTIMLTPIAVSVGYAMLGGKARGAPLTIALLLGLAYGASIGGIATPVGTPTNLIVIGYIENQFGISIGFASWMSIGLPVVALMLPACWLTVTRLGLRVGAEDDHKGREIIRRELERLGPMRTPERRVLAVFSVVALAWMLRKPLSAIEIGGVLPFAGVTDHVIAIAGAISLFLLPAGPPGERLLDWESARKLPWGIILLFGGGLSLAAAITDSGLALWLGQSLQSITSMPFPLLVGSLVLLVIFSTELISNIATASALLPVIGALALAGNSDPLLLSLPVAMAASCAFMLPVATGPNAIVFATEEISIARMARIGLILNSFGVLLITAAIVTLAPFMLSQIT